MIARRDIQDLLKSFVIAELYTDKRKTPEARAASEANGKVLESRFKTVALPLYVILAPDGKEVARLAGRTSVSDFTDFLKKGINSVPSSSNGN